MVDRESIRRRLRQLDRRLGLLESIRSGDAAGFIADVGVQAQAERHLQVAIQATIDIALHLVAEDGADTPETYASAFRVLAEVGVVDPGLADRLQRATGLRNLLVHAYLEVDPTRIWDQLGQLDDLRAFALAVETKLRG